MTGLLVTGLVGALAVVMIAVERVKPGRVWPKVPGWWPRALLLDGVQISVPCFLPVGRTTPGSARTVPGRPTRWASGGARRSATWCTRSSYYWWPSPPAPGRPFWRWVHQVHHSPQRIEVITSFYKHPIELANQRRALSVVLYAIVGLRRRRAPWRWS
jgi:hypothetical protein